MKTRTENEIRQLVTRMEILSDSIVEAIDKAGLGIDERSEDALRSIKSSVSSISLVANNWTEEEREAYLPVLEHIAFYLRSAVANPRALADYSEGVMRNVEEYIRGGKTYDAENEKRMDTEMDSLVRLGSSTESLARIDKRQKLLVDSQVEKEISSDSPEYWESVARFNYLTEKKKSEKARHEGLQGVVQENVHYGREFEKKKAFEERAELRTTSFEEYARMAYDNKELENEEKAMKSAIERIALEVGGTSTSSLASDIDFRRAMEDTLFERIARDHADNLDGEIAAIEKPVLFEAILNITRKMDALEAMIESAKGEQKKQYEDVLKNVLAVYEKTQNSVALRDDLIDDIEKEVEYCLDRNPVDLQGAQLKIRSCIECYCRYKKGVDLNDGLFFRNKESVHEKLRVAKVDEAILNDLAGIYKKTNSYIHSDLSIADMDKNQIKQNTQNIRKRVKRLREWEIDKYSAVDGIKTFYVRGDEMLLERLDNGTIDRSFIERDTKSIEKYFERLEQIKKFMQKNKIEDVPTIKFNSVDDVHKYLEKKDAAEKQDQPASVPANKPAAPNGNPDRLVGEITRFNAVKGIGTIDKKYYFNVDYLSDRAKDESLCRIGAKVSYVIGENPQGVCAKKIRIMGVAEKA